MGGLGLVLRTHLSWTGLLFKRYVWVKSKPHYKRYAWAARGMLGLHVVCLGNNTFVIKSIIRELKNVKTAWAKPQPPTKKKI